MDRGWGGGQAGNPPQDPTPTELGAYPRWVASRPVSSKHILTQGGDTTDFAYYLVVLHVTESKFGPKREQPQQTTGRHNARLGLRMSRCFERKRGLPGRWPAD